MTEDDSNRTLLDFESSNDGDDARDGDAATVVDDASVDEETDGGGEETDGSGEGADGGGEETVGADGSDDSGDADDAVAVRDPGSVSPAVSTSRYVPDGESCASCGASTRRLWVAEGDVVCVDCKAW